MPSRKLQEVHFSDRSEPAPYYAQTDRTKIIGGFRWLNHIKFNADKHQDLSKLLEEARVGIRELGGQLDVLSVHALTPNGEYITLEPLATTLQSVRRFISEAVNRINPLNPYSFPERGNSYVINSGVDLRRFLLSEGKLNDFSRRITS